MQKAFILKMSWMLGPCWPMNRSGQKVKPSVRNEGLVVLCRVFRMAYFPTTPEDSSESQGALCKCFFPIVIQSLFCFWVVWVFGNVVVLNWNERVVKWQFIWKKVFFSNTCLLETGRYPIACVCWNLISLLGSISPRVKWGFIFLLVPFIIGRDAENSGPPKVLLFHSI